MKSLLRKKLWRDAWAMRGRIGLLVTVVMAGMALSGALYQSYGDLRESYDHMYDANQLAHVFITLDRPRPIPADPAALLGSRGVQHVAEASARLSLPGVVEVDGTDVQAQFIGVPAHAWPTINDLCVRASEPWGYACTPGEKARAGIRPLGTDDAAFLHAGFADARDVREGQRLEARVAGENTTFHVSGMALNSEFLFPWTNPQLLIFDPGASAILWVQQEHLERLTAASLGTPGPPDGLATDIYLRMTTGDEEEKARRLVELYDGQPERFADLGFRTVETREDTFIYQLAEADIEGFRDLSPIVAFIGLVIATITIAVTMDRLVLAQRPVIGVLRALGASRWRLINHYLGLAVLIGAIGAAVGTGAALAGGTALSRWYREIIGFPVLLIQPRASILLTLAAIAVGACAIGGLRAAIHAARLPITAAMRPQAAHHPGALMRRLTARVKLATRLALRNVTRSPRRAAFTLGGMALSIVLTFGMIGLLDSFLVALDEQMARDTWDGLVTVGPAQDQAAVADAMARVSWIAQAEPFVTVPALVDGMDDPIILTGLARDSLKELEAIEGDISLLDTNGIVASQVFLQQVEDATGDRLTIGSPFTLIVDGQRHDVELAGIVNELLGSSIYLPRETVQDYLGAPLTTGAYVEVASGRTARSEDLANVPGFVDLTLKEEVEESLEETLGDSIQFAILFGAIGAILGIIVILNTAAVNLQERAFEHGTLKALGLPDRVLIQVLAIEHLIIGGVASVLGAGLGYLAAQALLQTFAGEVGEVAFSMPLWHVLAVMGGVIVLAQVPTVTAIRSLRKLDLPSLVKARGG